MSKYYKAEDVEIAIADTLQFESEVGKPYKVFLDSAKDMLKNLQAIEVSEDCISVEDIGKTLNEWLADKEMAKFATKVLRLNAPRAIPTTEQSSKVGEWIACTKEGLPLTELGRKERQKWYGYKCSKCNFIYKGNALTESPFCQTCGAKMRLE